MKKIIAFFLILTMIFTFAACAGFDFDFGPADATTETEETESGDMSWELSEDGVLEISGSGSVSAVPVDKTAVKEIVIGEGFDRIGSGAFAGMSEAVKVSIPDSVKEIGEEAFKGCKKIESIEIPDSVKSIAESAFDGWEDTQKIIAEWYEGNVEHWKEWFDFDGEFGEYFDKIKNGEAIPEDVEARLSAWWARWKESDFWKNLPSEEDVSQKADSFFGYWSEFGSYMASDDESAEPKSGWWEQIKSLTGYIVDKSKNAAVEIPQGIKDIIESHKDEIDAAVKFIQEGGASASDKLKDGADWFKKLWDSFFGD